MAHQKSSSILPLAATIPAVLFVSAWIYQRIHQKLSDASTANNNREEPVHDVLINREIGIASTEAVLNRRLLSRNTITIAYASTTGTCASYATKLHTALQKLNNNSYVIQVVKVAEVDWWDELLNNEEETTDLCGNPPILLFILPTWTNGTLPPESQIIIESLQEITSDWRVAPEPLRGKESVRVGAFGYVTMFT
jgi:hypothetical protein